MAENIHPNYRGDKDSHVKWSFGVPKSASQMRIDQIKEGILAKMREGNLEKDEKIRYADEGIASISSMADDASEAAQICAEMSANLEKRKQKISSVLNLGGSFSSIFQSNPKEIENFDLENLDHYQRIDKPIRSDSNIDESVVKTLNDNEKELQNLIKLAKNAEEQYKKIMSENDKETIISDLSNLKLDKDGIKNEVNLLKTQIKQMDESLAEIHSLVQKNQNSENIKELIKTEFETITETSNSPDISELQSSITRDSEEINHLKQALQELSSKTIDPSEITDIKNRLVTVATIATKSVLGSDTLKTEIKDILKQNKIFDKRFVEIQASLNALIPQNHPSPDDKPDKINDVKYELATLEFEKTACINWIQNLRNEISRIQTEYEDKKYANDTLYDSRQELARLRAEQDLLVNKINSLKNELHTYQIKHEEVQSMKNLMSEIKYQIDSLSKQRDLLLNDIKLSEKIKEKTINS